MNISIIMPVIGSIGMIIISIILIIRSMEKRERIKSVDVAKFDSFAEEMRREIAEIKKDLQTVKEKVEVIDKMMKENEKQNKKQRKEVEFYVKMLHEEKYRESLYDAREKLKKAYDTVTKDNIKKQMEKQLKLI